MNAPAADLLVFIDVICPWCFVGKRRLEHALTMIGESVRVTWLPFELNPDMPKEGMERRAYRTHKFGSWERSVQLDGQMTEMGEGEGISFHFERMARTPNTFNAHRLIWLARQAGGHPAGQQLDEHGLQLGDRLFVEKATLAAALAVQGADHGSVTPEDRGRHDGLDANQTHSRRRNSRWHFPERSFLPAHTAQDVLAWPPVALGSNQVGGPCGLRLPLALVQKQDTS